MPFLAILNLYQSFLGKNCQKTGHFGKTTIFDHSEFIPVFLGKIVRKNLECHFWPFQIYDQFIPEKNFFDHSEFIPVFLGKTVKKIKNIPFLTILNFTSLVLGKIVGKNWYFNAIFGIPNLYQFCPNLYQSFWEKLSEKIWNAIFGHSKFIPVFFGKIVRKNLECHFWPFWIYTSLFGKTVKKI